MAKLTKEKKTAFEYIEENSEKISDLHQLIWRYAEPALREYKSYEALVGWHREEGFDVEDGIARASLCRGVESGTSPPSRSKSSSALFYSFVHSF
jgi:metal-dependent amidase/aminoacylase/carboxypeptidase family protein